jgi:hypothetical protein
VAEERYCRAIAQQNAKHGDIREKINTLFSYVQRNRYSIAFFGFFLGALAES